mgnify:CR=1 FL=1
MGRIKTTLVKRTGARLFRENPDDFKPDFEHNKKAVSEAALVHSKKLRNVIAGYVTKLSKRSNSKK